MGHIPPKTPKVLWAEDGVFEFFLDGERVGEKSEKIVRERRQGTGSGCNTSFSQFRVTGFWLEKI